MLALERRIALSEPSATIAVVSEDSDLLCGLLLGPHASVAGRTCLLTTLHNTLSAPAALMISDVQSFLSSALNEPLPPSAPVAVASTPAAGNRGGDSGDMAPPQDAKRVVFDDDDDDEDDVKSKAKRGGGGLKDAAAKAKSVEPPFALPTAKPQHEALSDAASFVLMSALLLGCGDLPPLAKGTTKIDLQAAVKTLRRIRYDMEMQSRRQQQELIASAASAALRCHQQGGGNDQVDLFDPNFSVKASVEFRQGDSARLERSLLGAATTSSKKDETSAAVAAVQSQLAVLDPATGTLQISAAVMESLLSEHFADTSTIARPLVAEERDVAKRYIQRAVITVYRLLVGGVHDSRDVTTQLQQSDSGNRQQQQQRHSGATTIGIGASTESSFVPIFQSRPPTVVAVVNVLRSAAAAELRFAVPFDFNFYSVKSSQRHSAIPSDDDLLQHRSMVQTFPIVAGTNAALTQPAAFVKPSAMSNGSFRPAAAQQQQRGGTAPQQWVIPRKHPSKAKEIWPMWSACHHAAVGAAASASQAATLTQPSTVASASPHPAAAEQPQQRRQISKFSFELRDMAPAATTISTAPAVYRPAHGSGDDTRSREKEDPASPESLGLVSYSYYSAAPTKSLRYGTPVKKQLPPKKAVRTEKDPAASDRKPVAPRTDKAAGVSSPASASEGTKATDATAGAKSDLRSASATKKTKKEKGFGGDRKLRALLRTPSAAESLPDDAATSEKVGTKRPRAAAAAAPQLDGDEAD
jgi:hypothetical protein